MHPASHNLNSLSERVVDCSPQLPHQQASHPRARPIVSRFLSPLGALILLTLVTAASAMSDDDGITLNIARKSSSATASGSKTSWSSVARGKEARKKFAAKRRREKPPTSSKPAPAKKQKQSQPPEQEPQDLYIPRSNRPWERKPLPEDVHQAEPVELADVNVTKKPLGKVRFSQAAPANRSDDLTFSAKSFADERLELLPSLVANLQHKFDASQMTLVQQRAVPAMLRGADVLIKARTGTGKTLAYLTPVVQWLAGREERVERSAGTHALVILPTRELGVQVHDVMTQLVRPFHWLVPGLLIGGEKKKSEKARIRKGLTMIAGTPGRVADHFATTESFGVSRMQFLILDEADRLMDMGFERDVSAICSHVSENRSPALRDRLQTVLVSATLDARVRQLSSRSLTAPVIVSDGAAGPARSLAAEEEGEEGEGGEGRQFSLPSKLRQHFVVVETKQRLVSLAAFLRQRATPATRECKAIVFVSCVAQVKFLQHVLARAVLPEHWKRADGDKKCDDGDADEEEEEEEDEESGRHHLLSLPVLALHGDMPQGERTEAFMAFTAARRAVLVCTDVAARGLDFPRVDWIVQYDAPTDVEEYVHRCGRTARMTTEGDAVLMLMPHEDKYLQMLAAHGLHLEMLPPDSFRLVAKNAGGRGRGRGDQHENFLAFQRWAEDVVATCEQAGQLAVDAYSGFIRAYATHTRQSKHIFHPKALHLGHVAASFGLREAPGKIKMAQRRQRERDAAHRKMQGRGGGRDRKKMMLGRGGQRLKGFDADQHVGLSAI